jgi:predicted RNA-binding protein YlqC (UPF0109 family)
MNNKTEVIGDFIKFIIKNILGGSDDFSINITQSTKNIIVQIEASQLDRGRIIGKRGITIDSLKTLTVGMKNSFFPDDRRKIILEVLEPDDDFQRRNFNN